VRALVLLLALAAGLGLTLRYPFVGVLLWVWFALEQPHREAYGFVQTEPLNLIIAAVTVLAWLVSGERKVPAAGFIFWLLVAFLVWMTFDSFFSFDPAWSWPYWDRTWTIFAMSLLVAATATSRIRMYALVWIAVISLFYYGVKGGVFTIMTGGHFQVWGPPNSIIGDNNQLALALLMALPLANYLRSQVADKRIAWLLLAAIVLAVIAIVGTYSRGALIGLGMLGLFMLMRLRNRFVYLTVASLVIVFVVQFMPEHFFDRMETIYTPTQSPSFEGRLDAWRVAFLYASDHFPFGAGFYGPQLAAIFHHYLPDRPPRAAHSIYFQVLGEHGFIGLAIYLTILAAAFLRCSRIISVTRAVPEQRWAHDLAIAIQASLFVFCVAGAALSMAYYDLFIMEVALLLPLREIILPERKQKRPKWAPPTTTHTTRANLSQSER
jgi:putative inorganic carbon (HCO3(-)) transporter